MKPETMLKMLAKVTGKKESDQSFQFGEGQEVVVLVATGQGLLSIDEVERVDVESSFVVAQSTRDRYCIDLDRIVGISMRDSGSNSAGFVGR